MILHGSGRNIRKNRLILSSFNPTEEGKNLRIEEKDSKNPFFHKSFIDNNSNGENPIHEYFYS
jgi:hypothetical protein